MKIFRSKIDRLMSKKEALKALKQKIKDKEKQNKAIADNKIKDIDRKLDKFTKLIDVEKSYARSIENK